MRILIVDTRSPSAQETFGAVNVKTSGVLYVDLPVANVSYSEPPPLVDVWPAPRPTPLPVQSTPLTRLELAVKNRHGFQQLARLPCYRWRRTR